MNHRKVQIKPSKIHNVGLYPIEDISIGEIVMEFNWEKVKKYIDISNYSEKKKRYWIRLWGTQFNAIPFEQYFHPVNFLNHSDNPNCILMESYQEMILYTQKKIDSHSELTVYYKLEEYF